MEEEIDYMAMMDELDSHSAKSNATEIVKAPFGWPGGKTKTMKNILPHLPYKNTWVEVFGGSMAITLARRKSKLEVYNDRYGGVVDFYKCLHDKEKMEALCDRLQHQIHAREYYYWCIETWENVEDQVERAARWYYTVQASFGSKGNSFGRATSGSQTMGTKLTTNLIHFPDIHERIKNITMENRNYKELMRSYDSKDTVFYCDPPYLGSSGSMYRHEFNENDHREFLETVFSMKGFVAVSGYANPLYVNQPWDDQHSWEQFVSIEGMKYTDGNGLSALAGSNPERVQVTEHLWIKEAN
jgi:DNA adenine methylase